MVIVKLFKNLLMILFNYYSLAITGVMFEIIGSFFLTLEALGLNWIESPLKKFVRFSNKIRSSLIKVLIIAFILLFPFLTGDIFKNHILTALILPISIFILLFSTMFDEANNLKKWAILSINNKKIGPLGFIMLLIGNLLHLISIILKI